MYFTILLLVLILEIFFDYIIDSIKKIIKLRIIF